MQDKETADSLCSRQFGLQHNVCVLSHPNSPQKEGFKMRMADMLKCLNQQQA